MSDEKPTTKNSTGMSRRVLMRWIMGLGAVSSVAAMASVLGTIKTPSSGHAAEIESGDRLVFALGLNKGDPITSQAILPGESALAYPAGKETDMNLVRLIRLGLNDYQPPTDMRWVPGGIVAYSAICTHLGCTVDYSHETMAEIDHPHLHCPCHGGVYNALQGAKVIAGPPPRALPQLPIEIRPNGEIVAAGPFLGPVGPNGG